MILNSSIEIQFDPDKVNRELIELLNKRSATFHVGGFSHNYSHEDPVFFRDGPLPSSQQQAIKKCPTCRYEFQNRDEMVFCTFCGFSNDAKCVKRTR